MPREAEQRGRGRKKSREEQTECRIRRNDAGSVRAQREVARTALAFMRESLSSTRDCFLTSWYCNNQSQSLCKLLNSSTVDCIFLSSFFLATVSSCREASSSAFTPSFSETAFTSIERLFAHSCRNSSYAS